MWFQTSQLKQATARPKAPPQIMFEFGSAFTRVILNGRLVFFEPTIFIRHKKLDKVWLIGEQAYQASDKLATEFEAIWPIKRKAVTHQAYFQTFVRALLKKLDLNTVFSPWNRLKIGVILPSELSQPQAEVFQTGLKQVLPSVRFYTTESLLLHQASFTSGQRFAIDLGQTTTFWVFNAGNVLASKHYAWGTKELNELLRRQVETQHACQLDNVALDKLKKQLVDFRLFEDDKLGKRLVTKVKLNQTGLGTAVMLKGEDLKPAVLVWQGQLLELVDDFFSQLTGSVASGLVENGLSLFGGLANLHGLTQSLTPKLGCEVKILAKPDLFLINLLAKNA